MQADGSFNGMVGMVERGEVELISSPIARTLERAKVMDYPTSIAWSAAAMFVRKNSRNEFSMQAFTSEFNVSKF